MNQPDVRQAARECVTRAKDFLAKGDEPSARYACLELRFAIEYIIYDLLQKYRDDLPYDAVKKWHPRDILNDMLGVDPEADCTVELRVGSASTPNVPPSNEEEWIKVGEERRFSKQWVKTFYSALGNFVHAPTIAQLESGIATVMDKMREKAETVFTECEQVLNSEISGLDLSDLFWFDCQDCKSLNRGRIKDPTQKHVSRCRHCRAVYDVEVDQEEKIKLTLRRSVFTCLDPCKAPNIIGTHRVENGAIFVCKKCSKRRKGGLCILTDWVDPDAKEVV